MRGARWWDAGRGRGAVLLAERELEGDVGAGLRVVRELLLGMHVVREQLGSARSRVGRRREWGLDSSGWQGARERGGGRQERCLSPMETSQSIDLLSHSWWASGHVSARIKYSISICATRAARPFPAAQLPPRLFSRAPTRWSPTHLGSRHRRRHLPCCTPPCTRSLPHRSGRSKPAQTRGSGR